MEKTFYLSLIQALTEFLPVSSTAHLIALSKLFHLPSAGRLTEVALHMGTLAVVLVYFRRDIVDMLTGLLTLLKGKTLPGTHKALMIILATLPAIGAGYLVNRYVGKGLRSLEVMGWASIFFGTLLFLADRVAPTHKRFESLTYSDAFIVGLLQVLALIPGASRSGCTLIAARLLGYDRQSAARFSFLLSIPVIVGASTLMILSVPNLKTLPLSMLWTSLLCFGMGYVVLTLLMLWLKRGSFALFALYRLVFGAYLLHMAYGFKF